MKIGEFVRSHIEAIFNYCEENPEELSRLMSKEYSNRKFKIGFPFCSESANIPLHQASGKQSRYWNEEYRVCRKVVRVTNHWPPPWREPEVWQRFASYLAEKGIDGRTPLHFAAVFGQAEVVIALIKAGADINAKDKYGETPLHYSAEQDDIKTALVLIKEGADINTKDKNGNTPLQIAIDEHGKDSTIALFLQSVMKKPCKANAQEAEAYWFFLE